MTTTALPTLVIVATDALARRGLVSLLEDQPFLLLAAVSADELLGLDEADVLLWDAHPDLDAAVMSQQALPVVALVAEEADAGRMLAAGAAGILLRTATATQLSAALNAVLAGLTVLEPPLLAPSASEPDLLFDELTPRELEVLELVSEGLANKAIARRLEISVSTVKFHVNALLGKLGAKTRTELAVRALQQDTYL